MKQQEAVEAFGLPLAAVLFGAASLLTFYDMLPVQLFVIVAIVISIVVGLTTLLEDGARYT